MKHRILLALGLSLAMVISPLTVQAAGADGYRTTGETSYYYHNSYEGNSGEQYNCNLYINDSGGFTRVEFIPTNQRFIVENYSSAYSLINKKTFSMELPLWGGFFAGKDYNFVVFGQRNSNESDSTEVLRVVKYSKSWQRLGDTKISAINTLEPFDAGSLSMTEDDDNLYIHTCHTMYKSVDDGLNHQASMNLVVTKEDMTFQRDASMYKVWNVAGNYVSHSFMQYSVTDGSYIYNIDHGDAYPRGIYFSMSSTDGIYNNPESYASIYKIDGATGSNYTGVEMGNIALGSQNAIIPISSVKMTNSSTQSIGAPKNICLLVTPKDITNGDVASEIWLTNYSSSNAKQLSTPRITKVTDGKFLIMWEENLYEKNSSLKFILVDEDGNRLTNLYTTTMKMGKILPVVKDEKVIWYSSGSYVDYYNKGASPTFYEIDCASKETIAESILTAAQIERRKQEAKVDKTISDGFAVRIYNKATGDHIYSVDKTEVMKYIDEGWNQETVDSYANTFKVSPTPSGIYTVPVYRVYNKNHGGFHLYTFGKGEADILVSRGWQHENGGNPVYYCASNSSAGGIGIYRAYNPNSKSGQQHYCPWAEYQSLLSKGWRPNNNSKAYWFSK